MSSTGFKEGTGDSLPWISKDPSASLVYGLDLSDWLAGLGAGVTLSAATWTVPEGLTKGTETFTGTTASIRLSGGTAGTSYDCACHFTASTGDEDDRSIRIVVRQR